MKNGSLMSGSDISHPGATDNKWTSITQIKNAGLGDSSTSGKNLNGDGAITLNEVLPTGAVVDKVYPKWVSDLTATFENAMLNEIKEYKDFGIRFDYNDSTWHLVLNLNLAKDKD